MSGVLIPIVLVVAVFLAQLAFVSQRDWKCENCGHVFRISPVTASFLPHSFPMRKLTTCPHCGARTWVSPVPKQRQS